MASDLDTLHGVTAVAKRLSVSRQTCYTLVKQGKIRAIELPNGQIRIREREVKRLLAHKPATHMKRPKKPDTFDPAAFEALGHDEEAGE